MIDISTYYSVIGRVIVQLQLPEYSYKQFYYIFLDEEYKYSNKKDNRFSYLLKTFKSKTQIKFKNEPDTLKKFNTIVDESIKLNKKRNEIVHLYLIISEFNNQEILLNYKDEEPHNLKPFEKEGILFPNENYKLLTLEEIETIGDRLEDNNAKLIVASIPFGIKRTLKNPYVNKEAILENWKQFYKKN
jgi:hypothetical protein